MNLTASQMFKAMNDKHTNVKDCEGQVMHPVAFHTHTYTDADNKDHTVLVIFNGDDGKMYKTEVSAFIDKFMKYDEAFGNLPDEEKPRIVISARVSKKGNRYANFDLVDTED